MTRTFLPFRNGITPLEDLAREVDSLVQNIFDPEDRAQQKFTPLANLAETETAYELTLDLPGMGPDEVSVELNDGQLIIAGERKSETEQSDKTYHRIERRYGKFRRVVSIPAAVDEEHVSAEFKDGVLCVTLPKSEKVRVKKISVSKS